MNIETPLVRTATHESAHICLGVLMHLPIGVTSIRGTAAFNGVCGYRGRMRTAGFDIGGLPLVLQRARPRRAIESMIRFRLAGPVADRLWFPRTGFTRTPKVPTEQPALPPVAAAELVALEERGNASENEFIHDEDAAYSLVVYLVGSARAQAYYSWALADTQRHAGR